MSLNGSQDVEVHQSCGPCKAATLFTKVALCLCVRMYEVCLC